MYHSQFSDDQVNDESEKECDNADRVSNLLEELRVAVSLQGPKDCGRAVVLQVRVVDDGPQVRGGRAVAVIDRVVETKVVIINF